MTATELMLDSQLISWEYNLARRLNPPVRHPNPILEPETPWEDSYVTVYGSVLPRKGGGFRMWYMSGAGGMQAQQMMCYAESDDGFSWKRILNQKKPYQGHSPNNIVLGPDINVHGPCVIENQHNDDPARKYLALFDSYPQYRPELKDVLQESRWTYAAWSADGYTWSPEKGHPAVAGKSDIGQSCVWDAANQRYIAYLRGTRGISKPGGSIYGEHHAVRYVRAATSTDFVHWSEPVEVFRCDTLDGDPYHQTHQLSVTIRDGLYIGLMSIFRITELLTLPKGGWMEEGPIDTQLIVSRDGFNWHRVANRQTFFPMGQPGTWDSHWIVTASHIVDHGDQMLFYYAGSSVPRSGLPSYDPKAKPGGRYRIGVASLPRDRFQSLSPQRLDQPAVIETKPLTFKGSGDLKLNANAHRGGQILVELCDYNGNAIEGFAKEDCTAVESDSLDHIVKWKGKSLTEAIDPNKIFQRAIRLRFYLHRASLYALNMPKVEC